MTPARRTRTSEEDATLDPGPPPVTFHPHAVEVVDRPEGYREFRCLPATWSYPDRRPLAALLTEFYSSRMDVDPQGIQGDPEFWSGSDAAIRLRALPPEDLALRELTGLATRRSTGLNAPKPWASLPEIRALAEAWEAEATDVHWTEAPHDDDEPTNLWSHYGMEESPALPIVTGYSMTKGDGPRRGLVRAWDGGPGTWYAWSTLVGWDRWPRRQEALGSAAVVAPGRLLLFVSHRWESLDHPDPSGSQLRCAVVGLTMALAAALLQVGRDDRDATTVSGLPEVIAAFLYENLDLEELTTAPMQEWARGIEAAAERGSTEEDFWPQALRLETAEVEPTLGRLRDLILVWYDYASMFQSPRAADEEHAFRREILELNAIQARAATVVIAGDEQYVSRAWCFLEVCGGMRHRIVELTPSWGRAVGVGPSLTRWASWSDQLIGALNTLGLDAIWHSGLEATQAEDLPDIARLLSELPLIGPVESDDSDLIGGAVPMPLRSGEWMFPSGLREVRPTREHGLAPTRDYGKLPPGDALRRSSREHAGADSLAGPVGMWMYATQRTLALAWAARAGEICRDLGTQLPAGQEGDLGEALRSAGDVSVVCTWADDRSLAEDGLGWTRTVPSGVGLLVIVTQDGLAKVCRIYERVLQAHLACDVPVVTFTPESGRAMVHLPDEPQAEGLRAEGLRADVLAVPRIRRSNAYGTQMLLPPGASREDVEVLAALRLDPSEGFVQPGRVSDEAAGAGVGAPGSEISASQLLGYSEQRVRAEGLARSTTASWDTWCTPRLHQSAWQVGMGALQVDVIERLVGKAAAVSENPFKRRKFLYLLVKNHEGYALPPTILEDADELIRLIHEHEEAEPARGKGSR